MNRGVMVFAAGLGTRMAPLTDDRPKPMVEVAGKPLLDTALTIAKEADAAPIVVNTHYKADQIRDHLKGQNVEISHEETLLDTGGGLKAAANHFSDTTAYTLNSDIVWPGPNPLHILDAAWDPTMGALLLCAHVDQIQGRDAPGDFTIQADGTLTRGGDMVYLGTQIINLNAVTDYPAQVFSLNKVWDVLAAENKLYACTYPGNWCDVGRPENIILAEAMLADSHV